METKKTRNWKWLDYETAKTKTKKNLQKLTSHTKWGHGDLSLPFHTHVEQVPLPYE